MTPTPAEAPGAGDIRDDALQDVLDKQVIREVLTDYCRSVDRLDRGLMESVWTAGATVEYEGLFTGTATELVDLFMNVHLAFASHSHQLTNLTVAIDGDTAVSEGYVTARIRSCPDEDGLEFDLVASGRYLDRWSRSTSSWTIDHRLYVADVFGAYEVVGAAALLPDTAEPVVPPLSRRDHEDPVYALFSRARARATAGTAAHDDRSEA